MRGSKVKVHRSYTVVGLPYRVRKTDEGWQWAMVGSETIDSDGDGWSDPRATRGECMDDLRAFREGC